MKTFVKDPEAILDYGFDWNLWLAGDTIDTSAWVVDSGLTIVPGSDVHDTTTTTVFLSGGVERQKYKLTNTITTAAGRTDERTILIRVDHR